MSRHYSLLTTLTMLLLTCTTLVQAEQRVLVLGDSLSDAYNMPREAGWVYRLDLALGEGAVMIDGSISGDTTSGARARLEALLDAQDPDYLIVILGGNDGLRGLSPNQLKANLADIIEQGQRAGAAVALMQIRLPANLGRRYLDQFEAVYPALADQFDIPLWPFFLEDLFDQPGMMMADGIHPSERAQPLLAEQVEAQLQNLLNSKQD